jgi:hypothetical protein
MHTKAPCDADDTRNNKVRSVYCQRRSAASLNRIGCFWLTSNLKAPQAHGVEQDARGTQSCGPAAFRACGTGGHRARLAWAALGVTVPVTTFNASVTVTMPVAIAADSPGSSPPQPPPSLTAVGAQRACAQRQVPRWTGWGSGP